MTVFRPLALFWLALLAASLGSSRAAAAEDCVACGITPGDSARSDGPAPLEIEFESTLNFDRVIVGGNGAGSVRLLPGGSADSSGAAETPSGRARIGRLIIHGEPGREIYVDFPKSLDLTGMKGSVVSVTALVTDLPANPRLDARGELAIEFGGQLDVRGDVDGDFRGNLMIRADYL